MKALIPALCFYFLACAANYREWQTPGCTFDKPDLTILQFSDTHVRNAADAQWTAERLATAISQYKPDSLVLTGDITSTGKESEWLALVENTRNFKSKLLVVWGNHDMPLKESGYAKEGKTHFADFGNYRLILIDTAWDGPFVGSYTSLPESAFPVLEKMAETEKNILLFAHHPLAKGAPHFRLRNADRVLRIFSGKKVIGVFTAHFHGAYLAPEGDVLFAGVAPLSSHQRNHTWSQRKGYRIIQIQGSCLRTEHPLVN